MANQEPPKTIQEEAGLPDNWQPVDRSPIIPSTPPAAQQQGPGSYFAGPLSPVIQHDAAFYQTKYGGAGIPETSLMPPSAATAANNAATSTVVKNILETAAAAASSGGSSSTFTPSLPVNKISAADYTVLIADLAELDSFSNNSGGVITLPAAALLPGTLGNRAIGSGLGSSASLTGTSTFAGTAISIINTESDLGSPSCVPTGAGWTAIDSAQNGAYASIYSHPVSVAPITVNYALGTSVSWIDSLTFIWNSTITTVQTRAIFSGGVSGTTSNSAAFTNPIAAGNTILVVVTVTAVPYDAIHSTWQYTTIGVSDGVNTYTQIIGATQGSAPGDGIQQVAFIATKVAGGSITITVTTDTPAGHAIGGVSATAYELNIGNGSPIQSGFPAGWYCYLQNTGSGTFTVQSTALIDGSSSPITLGPNQGTIVAFDGTNWFTERGMGGGTPVVYPLSIADGGTGTSTPALIAGANITITGTWPDQTITASEGAGADAISFWAYPLSSGEVNVASMNPVSSNNMNFSANTVPMYYIHIDDFLTVANFTFHVTVADSTAGHNYDWGMYNLSGELIWNLGATSFPSTGVVTTPFAQGTVTIVPGNYWLAFTGNHTGLEFDGITASQLAEFWFLASSGSTPWWQSVTPSTGGTLTGLSPTLPTTPTATSLTNASVHSYGGQGIIPVIALST
jgi:hypothetical protein